MRFKIPNFANRWTLSLLCFTFAMTLSAGTAMDTTYDGSVMDTVYAQEMNLTTDDAAVLAQGGGTVLEVDNLCTTEEVNLCGEAYINLVATMIADNSDNFDARRIGIDEIVFTITPVDGLQSRSFNV